MELAERAQALLNDGMDVRNAVCAVERGLKLLELSELDGDDALGHVGGDDVVIAPVTRTTCQDDEPEPLEAACVGAHARLAHVECGRDVAECAGIALKRQKP